MTILGHDRRWLGVLGYNEFAQRIETLRAPPWDAMESASTGHKPGPWGEDDDPRLQAWLERHYGQSYGLESIRTAVDLAAKHQRHFHPVRDYLRSLRWDGRTRLPTLFSEYFGAEPSDYLSLIGVFWPVSAVARALDPGCKVDTVLILEGEQGKQKSSALCALATCPEWFLDTALPIGDKDTFEMLRGKWIIEFAELESWRRVHYDQLKGFLSRSRDTYRPPYGRRAMDLLRQCVFAATTNERIYLADPSGGRRFWPVACRAIDVQALRRDVDQLWAEAVVHYQQRPRWWPESEAEMALCRAEQEARHVADPWEAVVRQWLAADSEQRRIADAGALTTNYVLTAAIGMKPDRIGRAEESRIGTVLHSLGFERVRQRSGDARPYVYVRNRLRAASTK